VFPIDAEDHLSRTDSEVLTAIRDAAGEAGAPGHEAARRIVNREHFRIAYNRQPDDVGARSLATGAIAAAAEHFGADKVRYGASPRRGDPPDFPVRERDGSSVSSLSLSEVLTRLPASHDEYVFVEPSMREQAKRWITDQRGSIIDQALAEQAHEEETTT